MTRNVTSISELIDRLEENEPTYDSPLPYLIDDWFSRYKEGDNNLFYELSGAIWALQAVCIISENERDTLLNNLVFINSSDAYHYDTDGNEFWIDEDAKRHYTRDEG